MEKMHNDVAKALKKASAEARRLTELGRVLELANFTMAVSRAPSRRSSF